MAMACANRAAGSPVKTFAFVMMRSGPAAACANASGVMTTQASERRVRFMNEVYSLLMAGGMSMRAAARAGMRPATIDAPNVIASEMAISVTGVWNALVQAYDGLRMRECRV